jgi:hypothetical protein
MRNDNRCAVCQKPGETILCASCKQQWDYESAWIQDLIHLEQQWRRINRLEIKYIATHIRVDGQLSRDQPFDVHELEQTDMLTGSKMLVNHIELWAEMGGLTIAEQHAFQLMKNHLMGNDAAEILHIIEDHDLSASAYNHRKQRVIHKIRLAQDAGEIDTEAH